jgi:predicted Zn-dependent protease
MAQARYCDGRSAEVFLVTLTISREGLSFADVAAQTHDWPIGDVKRVDDGVGAVILRRTPDDGARLHLDDAATAVLRAHAPALFDRGPARLRHAGLVATLTASAAGLLAFVLFGLPLLAAPMAKATPPTVEARIGGVLTQQILSTHALCEGPGADTGHAALNRVAQRLTAKSDRAPTIYIDVIDAPYPNAFALPGGQIFITGALLDLADHPDQIAAVIAHEIAHVDQRHSLAGVIRQLGSGVMIDILIGGSGLGQTAAGATISIAGLRYTRAAEEEADILGRRYLTEAGMNTNGMEQMFNKLVAYSEKNGQGEDEPPEFLSSHPAIEKRAAAARSGNVISTQPPAFDDAQWSAIKSMCPVPDEEEPMAP